MHNVRLHPTEFEVFLHKYEQMLNEESKIFEILGIDSVWKPGTWINDYYDLLTELCDFSDEEKSQEGGTLLDYFVYKLDFGRKWEPGMYTVDGEDVPLKTALNLYFALLKY